MTHELYEEMKPLLLKHYEEVAHFKDIPLDPDVNFYVNLEDHGFLVTFVARDEDVLIGYCVFIVKHNPHYKGSLQGVEDVIYIDPQRRGFGRKFIIWCDEELKKLGVDVSYHHVKMKPELDFSPLLKKLGYEYIDGIYGRRL
jgi:hypothetical protein